MVKDGDAPASLAASGSFRTAAFPFGPVLEVILGYDADQSRRESGASGRCRALITVVQSYMVHCMDAPAQRLFSTREARSNLHLVGTPLLRVPDIRC